MCACDRGMEGGMSRVGGKPLTKRKASDEYQSFKSKSESKSQVNDYRDTAEKSKSSESKIETKTPTTIKTNPKPKAKKAMRPKAPKFPYTLPYASLNLRLRPELYRIGRGEEGVLSVQPYKSELLPLWRFKTPSIAHSSSSSLLAKFYEYLEQGDFVGCDLARKFIQMGVTRARRYANHKGGRKYLVSEDGSEKIEMERTSEDREKAACARIFGDVLKVVREDERYLALERRHREMYDGFEIPEGLVGLDVKEDQIARGPKKVTLAQARKRRKVKEEEEEEGEEEEQDREVKDEDEEDAQVKAV